MEDFKQETVILKAFSDENRLRILSMLREGEKCACDLLEKLKISQSTLSHHMKILCESSLVECWNEGKWTHYKISIEGREKVLQLVKYITGYNR